MDRNIIGRCGFGCCPLNRIIMFNFNVPTSNDAPNTTNNSCWTIEGQKTLWFTIVLTVALLTRING